MHFPLCIFHTINYAAPHEFIPAHRAGRANSEALEKACVKSQWISKLLQQRNTGQISKSLDGSVREAMKRGRGVGELLFSAQMKLGLPA